LFLTRVTPLLRPFLPPSLPPFLNSRKSAKRVLLPSLGDNATSGVFVGPYGPYVRDLLPGEPSDGLLLREEAAAKAFYQDVWADDDAGFMKSTSEVREGGREGTEALGLLIYKRKRKYVLSPSLSPSGPPCARPSRVQQRFLLHHT